MESMYLHPKKVWKTTIFFVQLGDWGKFKMELKRSILEVRVGATGRKLSSCDDCSTRPSWRPGKNENGEKTILKCPQKNKIQ